MHMELVKKDKISKEEGLSQDMVILEGGNPRLVTKRRKKKITGARAKVQVQV